MNYIWWHNTGLLCDKNVAYGIAPRNDWHQGARLLTEYDTEMVLQASFLE